MYASDFHFCLKPPRVHFALGRWVAISLPLPLSLLLFEGCECVGCGVWGMCVWNKWYVCHCIFRACVSASYLFFGNGMFLSVLLKPPHIHRQQEQQQSQKGAHPHTHAHLFVNVIISVVPFDPSIRCHCHFPPLPAKYPNACHFSSSPTATKRV